METGLEKYGVDFIQEAYMSAGVEMSMKTNLNLTKDQFLIPGKENSTIADVIDFFITTGRRELLALRIKDASIRTDVVLGVILLVHKDNLWWTEKENTYELVAKRKLEVIKALQEAESMKSRWESKTYIEGNLNRVEGFARKARVYDFAFLYGSVSRLFVRPRKAGAEEEMMLTAAANYTSALRIEKEITSARPITNL